jgi:cardiolipin synthase
LDPGTLISAAWHGIQSLPWQWLALIAHVVLATLATIHAMLFKRDPRAALGWVSACIFFPLAGPLAYYLFGINRIQTRARRLVESRPLRWRIGYERGIREGVSTRGGARVDPPLRRFFAVSDRVTSRPLMPNNTVDMLENGEEAYPAMLAAIDAAEHRVLLLTYLFELDAIGETFVTALRTAQRRGVDVRVIVDGVGERYSRPRVSRVLRRAGVPVACFMAPRLLPPSVSVNLRNHRKILVVDGKLGFTGGMNIGARHLARSGARGATADLHFRVRGPVVGQLEDIFVEDWRFVTGETLDFARIGPVDDHGNGGLCRCISDGPNEDLDKISLVLMGTISAARHEILIVTPYFLPSREMIASLQSAALRGVAVTVILPRRSNLPFVDWATRNLLWELLQHGVSVRYQPPPFAHTKLFVVDGVYAQVGSANMDPRSLRLNFELNLELSGATNVDHLVEYTRKKCHAATQVSLHEIEERGLAVRLRDAACWLFLPYL